MASTRIKEITGMEDVANWYGMDRVGQWSGGMGKVEGVRDSGRTYQGGDLMIDFMRAMANGND